MTCQIRLIRAFANRRSIVAITAVIVLALPLVLTAQTEDANDAKRDAARAQALRAQASEERHNELVAKRQRMMERQQKLVEAQAALLEAQKAYEMEQHAGTVELSEQERARLMAEEAQNLSASDKGAQLQRLQMELEAARAQLEMLRQQGKQAPLPENAQTKIFNLRNIPAAPVADAITKIMGDQAMRMAVDHRSNSIIVSGDEKIMKLVEKLVIQLGETASSQEDQRAETLQLRIVWLLDGVKGEDPTDTFVSPQVVEALHQLGFEDPRVVCQQVTTLTLGEELGRGQFRFGVPVIVNGQLWQLGGSGNVSSISDDRFAVQFELEFAQTNGTRQRRSQSGQLGGSIYTPLGHYTVMGTTTFVATSAAAPEPGSEGAFAPQQQQHLSAFVVYLDRAQEFPAAKPQ